MADRTVVLFDDEREFRPGFCDDAIVVRTVADAEELFEKLSVIDELWLDYVLRPGDTTEALHALKGVEVKRIIFHSSAFAARGLVEAHLQSAGIHTEVELINDKSMLLNPYVR